LDVDSDLVLPGLIDRPAGPAEVTVRHGDVPENLPNPREDHATYQVEGDRFLLTIPDVARFLLEGGKSITYQLVGDGDAADAAIFILGTAFGILLHQRGDFVLHASAVRVGGHAILFAGSSGAGKSTMAAALVKRGYPMITDDVCAISLKKGDVPRVLSDGRQLKLWANSIERLELADAKGAAVRNKIQKFYVTPSMTDDTPLPVGAVYLLREARTGGDTIQVTNFVDATLMLQRNCYRPRLVKALSQGAQYLQASAAVVAKAGVFMFQRTIDFRAMDNVIERLETHWRSLGFLEPLP
jgi:hypothetical protein